MSAFSHPSSLSTSSAIYPSSDRPGSLPPPHRLHAPPPSPSAYSVYQPPPSLPSHHGELGGGGGLSPHSAWPISSASSSPTVGPGRAFFSSSSAGNTPTSATSIQAGSHTPDPSQSATTTTNNSTGFPISHTPQTPWSVHLPDAATLLLSFEGHHLSLLSDVRSFVDAKTSLDREYGAKLHSLVRKTSEKIGFAGGGSDVRGGERRLRALCVGEEGNQTWEEGYHVRSTLLKAVEGQLGLLEKQAEQWGKTAEDTSAQVLEEIKKSEMKKHDIRKKISSYTEEVVESRDKLNIAREKWKSRYYDSCADVESLRAKLEKSHLVSGGEGSTSEKLKKQYEDAIIEMNITKSEYILSIRAWNDVKNRFYREDCPRWSEEIQEFHASTVYRLVTLMAHTGAIDAASHLNLARFSQAIWDGYQTVDIAKDQDFFANWNIRKSIADSEGQREGEGEGEYSFRTPPDAVWEPCPGYYSEQTLDTSAEPDKVFLQNRLAVAKREVARAMEMEQRQDKEIASAKCTITNYEKKRGIGDPDDFRDSMLATLKDLTLLQMRTEQLEGEISSLEQALGDDVGPQRPHEWKSATFTIPADCDFCNSNIWGLTKPGYTCKRCSANVHVKCSMRIPSDCSSAVTGPSDKRKSAFSLHRKHGSISSSNSSVAGGASKRMSFMGGRKKSIPPNEYSQPLPPPTQENVNVGGSGVGTGSDGELRRPLGPRTPAESNHSGQQQNPFDATSLHASLPGYTPMSPTRMDSYPHSRPSISTTSGDVVLATVLFDYVAGDVDELSVQKGQVVQIVPPSELIDDGESQEGWIKVRQIRDHSGRPIAHGQATSHLEGLVPENYLRIQQPPRIGVPDSPGANNNVTNGDGGVPMHSSSVPSSAIPAASPSQLSVPPSSFASVGALGSPDTQQPNATPANRRVQALYQYRPAPDAPDEIPLEAGQLYYLTSIGWTWGLDDGSSAVDSQGRSEWWEVTDGKGRIGVAPGNYLTLV